uniref:Serpentine receptor class gamma n=1 Tax=Parascaris equorum TaxID=6256 RepID=A0A914S4J9_PAREQ
MYLICYLYSRRGWIRKKVCIILNVFSVLISQFVFRFWKNKDGFPILMSLLGNLDVEGAATFSLLILRFIYFIPFCSFLNKPTPSIFLSS